MFTAAEFQQLNNTRLAAYDALVIVKDAVCHTLDRVLCAATSEGAIAIYRTIAKLTYHGVMLTAAAAFYAGVIARHGWEMFVQWAAAYVARCERPAPICLVLPAAPVPVALLAPVIEIIEEHRILVTPSPVQESVKMPGILPTFEPISISREVAVKAYEMRFECDRLQSYCTDEAAYTMDERQAPHFQGFLQDLEQCAREVARLYCKRSKSNDEYKASLVKRANTLIERNRSPQVATMPKPKRHLQAVK